MILRKKDGQTTVEFALIAILLMVAVFAIIELGFMFFANLSLQHAVREGARYAITGRVDSSLPGRRASVIQTIKDSSMGFCAKNECDVRFYRLDLDNNATEIDFKDDDPKIADVGMPNEIIIIQLDYSWPLITFVLRPFFPKGHYDFTVRATMKNEPFPVT